MRAVCSLGLPQENWASVNPDGAIAHLVDAIDKTAEMGAEALSGVTYGGIGERTGVPPTMAEVRQHRPRAGGRGGHAKAKGIAFGIEPVNRYENHLINTAAHGVAMIETDRRDNIFLHLDTYHMNIEEKGAANGISTPATTSATSTSPKATAAPRARAAATGTKSTPRSPPSASRAASPWRASSTCRPKSPMGWPSGARGRELRGR
jgi:hypothetical protein